MRESSKIDKTKLPVDAYDAWLKTQRTPPERPTRHNRGPTDYYEEWLGRRVKVRAKTDAAKHKARIG